METFPANAVSDNILALDLAPECDFIRKRHLIDQWPVKIDDFIALFADQVMMALMYCLEPGLAVHGFYLLSQAMEAKGCKGAVYGIQRDRWESFLHPQV